jgi:hypothetical protein
MRRAPVVALGLLTLTALSGAWHTAEAQGSSELAGGWIVTSWTSPDGTVNDQPQKGLFLFTATGQYSMMYIRGDEPRPRYEGESQTDEEILAAYNSFTANSGRYTVDGNQLVYEAYMAKDPNYMADFMSEEGGNGVTVTFGISGGILTLEWADGQSAGQKATLRRPGQPQG